MMGEDPIGVGFCAAARLGGGRPRGEPRRRLHGGIVPWSARRGVRRHLPGPLKRAASGEVGGDASTAKGVIAMSRSRHGSPRGVDGLPKQLWQASSIGIADACAIGRDDRARVTNQVRASACPTPIPKSLALLTPRRIGEVTSRGDAVVPAQTTPMRAIAAKRERGSGVSSRGGRNASRWFTILSAPR